MAEPALDLVGGARRLGHLIWVERRLFEILGGWVPSVPDTDVKVFLGTRSRHHAWHVDLLQACLPRQPELDAEALTVPWSPEAVTVFDDIAGGPDHDTVERLVALVRVVLPRLVVAYDTYRDRLTPVADAPTMRALGFVLGDLADEWRAGERLLEGVLADPADVHRAAARQAGLEGALLAAGGVGA